MSDELREAEAWDQRPPKRYLSELSIRNHSARGYDTRVLLNGAEVPGLHAVTVEWEFGGITTATLEIAVDHIDVDSATVEILASLATNKADHGDG